MIPYCIVQQDSHHILWKGSNRRRACLTYTRGTQQNLRLYMFQRCTFRMQRWGHRSNCLQDTPGSLLLTLMLAATYRESMDRTASRGRCLCLMCPGRTRCIPFGHLQPPAPLATPRTSLLRTGHTPLLNRRQGQQSQAHSQHTRLSRQLRICRLGTELRRTVWLGPSRNLDTRRRIRCIQLDARTSQ